MELAAAGIPEQPFRTHGRPLTFVTYEAQAAACDFLRTTYELPRGLGLLQGPSLSGKTSIIYHFSRSLNEDASVAVVNGRGLLAEQLLDRVLQAFGFDMRLDSMNERLNMLRVFVMQQASAHHAPLIIIENVHALHPDSLKVLCDLAKLRWRSNSAVRLVLASDRALDDMLRAPALECLAKRITGSFHLAPMDEEETVIYLHSKLRAGGCDKPETVVPDAVCEAIHVASGGWPGIVDRLMLLALAKTDRCPLTPDRIERPVVPALTGESGLRPVSIGGRDARLYLTHNGRTLREIPLTGERVMIGRSEHNDVAISSRFISRHHALFIHNGNTTLLMDLNSTNGTFVNSRRVSNHIMVHDDVVTIGHHGLKFVDPAAVESLPLEGASFNDTVIMKSIDDMRRLLARENTQALDIALPGDETRD